jgi:hypothetical protein
MLILAIDPSINNVGLALYNTETGKLITRVLHPPKLQRQYLLSWICNQIQCVEFFKNINTLVIEYPTFQNSAKGRIAAQKGYTLDLAYIAGYISAECKLKPSCIHLPTPQQWKGNLPKAAVGRRFQRRFGIDPETITDHEYEAAMMIAWCMDSTV